MSAFFNNISSLKHKTIVIKIGGGALNDDATLRQNAKQISTLRRFGAMLVVVHGAGPQIKSALAASGIDRKRHTCGRWMTSRIELPIISQAMNEANNKLAKALRDVGVFSLTAAELTRPLVKAISLDNKEDDLTGLPQEADVIKIGQLLREYGIIITHSLGYTADSTGLLNVNADDYATSIAKALRASVLVMATNTNGVLHMGNTIQKIATQTAQRLVSEGVIIADMAVKVETALHATQHGVKRVIITNAKRPGAILRSISGKGNTATIICDR